MQTFLNPVYIIWVKSQVSETSLQVYSTPNTCTTQPQAEISNYNKPTDREI